MINSVQLRSLYLDFFRKKNHHVIPSAPVVPENDASVLYTTAGMHPLVPYLLGQPHPSGKRLVNVQKCVRTDDIDEVGDTFHHTFFEMLGNWSLGDYFKQEAITWSYEFLTDVLDLDPTRLYVSCFAGDDDAPKDETSANIWKSLGIPQERIYFFGKKDNWWGPAGQTGPCGPDTEMHYDTTGVGCSPDCGPGCSCQRFCEIWNNVFMEYNKTASGKFEKLTQPNVDTGMGLERTLAVINGLSDNYLTDLWTDARVALETSLGNQYLGYSSDYRIILDHVRAAIFIASDGVLPANKQQGYILRRLIRRAALKIHLFQKDPVMVIDQLVTIFIRTMKPAYPELSAHQEDITRVIKEEVGRFLTTLSRGLHEFNKLKDIDGLVAFNLFQTYGFPWELTAELAAQRGNNIDRTQFEQEFTRHQQLSRSASKGMFKGGLQDHSEVTTKYHTATHLLHKSLRNILGNHVQQRGSNITSERLRFDFSHDSKLTPDQITKVEQVMNNAITADLPVTRQEIAKEKALKEGALAFFPEKYPEIASVYTIGSGADYFSKELCGGPHVSSTGEIGSIKIIKEESAGSGIRRIYATLTTAS